METDAHSAAHWENILTNLTKHIQKEKIKAANKENATNWRKSGFDLWVFAKGVTAIFPFAASAKHLGDSVCEKLVLLFSNKIYKNEQKMRKYTRDVLSLSQYCDEKSASMSLWRVGRQVFQTKSVIISSRSKEEWRVVRTTVTIMPVVLCAPRLYRSSSKAKERAVCKTAAAPASFKYDVWRLFGFPASRNEEGEQVTHRQTTIQRHRWAITNTHLWHFSAHVLAFKVVLINAECALSLKKLDYSI